MFDGEGCREIDAVALGAAPTPPPWASLQGDRALYDGAEWTLLRERTAGPERSVAPVVAAALQAPLATPEEARRLRLVDAIFSGLLITVLLAAGWALLRKTPSARRRRAAYDDGWLPPPTQERRGSTH